MPTLRPPGVELVNALRAVAALRAAGTENTRPLWQIVNAQSGTPINDARIDVSAPTYSTSDGNLDAAIETVRTDDQGCFLLHELRGHDVVSLRIEKPEFFSMTVPLAVSEMDGRTGRILRMNPVVSMSGELSRVPTGSSPQYIFAVEWAAPLSTASLDDLNRLTSRVVSGDVEGWIAPIETGHRFLLPALPAARSVGFIIQASAGEWHLMKPHACVVQSDEHLTLTW